MRMKSLRSRIIITVVVITTITSTLFGAGLLLIKQKLEEATFGRMVDEQLQILLKQTNPQEIISSTLLKGWQFYQGESITSLPEHVQRLSPGSYHSVGIGERYYHIEVSQWQQQAVFLVYDVTAWEDQEHALLRILCYGVIVILVVAVFMGVRASRTILLPVRRLTDRVSNIQPGQREVRIANEFEGTEVGQIAAAVDAYLERLDQFVEREQSFTAAASHELRTPLSVMMGAVDVLDVNPQNDASSRAVHRIKRACDEMLAFIEAALFLSREEANSIDQSSSSDVKEVVQGLLEDNKGRIEALGIQVDTDITESLLLEQPQSIVKITIGNLLRNAIEHTRDGTISINVSSSQIVIADTGEGIPEEHLPYIFDRSYTTKAEGTGMGLNLVKRICDRFNWAVSVNSVVGEGTTVTLTFQQQQS